jgi:hypothetical protein
VKQKMSETPKQKKSDIPTSPDSFKFNPPNICPGAPNMGGMQTGGYAVTPSTEPKPQLEPSPPDQMIKRTVLQKQPGA